MQLHIDTSEYGKLRFKLVEKGKKDIVKEFQILPHESNRILENLDSFLHQSKIKDKGLRISRVIVYKGSGSFTGLRIGVAVAEGLGMVWNVPIQIKKHT